MFYEVITVVMENPVRVKNIGELVMYGSGIVPGRSIRERVHCVPMDAAVLSAHFSAPVILNASIGILVLSGSSTVFINYRPYPVKKNAIILLSASHLFCFTGCSSDFRCLGLFVSREFTDEMDSTDMIYRRIKYGVKLYNAPVIQLSAAEVKLLRRRMEAVDRSIDHMEHLFHKDVILNNLFAFYLDLSDIIDRRAGFSVSANLTRYESIIKSFIELLAVHYREEHKVEFYSSRLHISAHYLTLIVKRITGQSVCDLIFEMLYGEARNLLSHSGLSVQQIAARLHFSDQSAFGKFFKRKSGLSPAEYRKG